MTPRTPDDEAERGVVAGFATSAATRPFWEALARGELLIPHCESCGRSFFPPREICPDCERGEVALRPATGVGTVTAASTVRLPLNGWPAEDVPYTAVLVRLDGEEVVLPGRLSEVSEEPIVGARVEIVFAADSESELPLWRLSPTG